YAERRYSGPANVKWFGATGDGTTDDTVTLQAAINSVPEGVSLFFPEGVYIVSTPLFMRSKQSWIGTENPSIKMADGLATKPGSLAFFDQAGVYGQDMGLY